MHIKLFRAACIVALAVSAASTGGTVYAQQAMGSDQTAQPGAQMAHAPMASTGMTGDHMAPHMKKPTKKMAATGAMKPDSMHGDTMAPAPKP